MNLESSRRDFLKLGLMGAGSLMFARPSFALPDADPHFFLSVILVGGADTSFLFDARPMAMTKAGKIHNFLGEEASPWVGTNGGSCLATRLTNPLKAFKDQFSVLNGVLMAPNFDGHDQNMNLLMAGNNFGGESFVPHLNLAETGSRAAELDSLINGYIPASLTNLTSSVPLSPGSADHLREKLSRLKPAGASDPLLSFIRSRYEVRARSGGRFGQAARLMMKGFDSSPQLHEKMKSLRPINAGLDPQAQFCNLIADSFKLGLARSAVWAINDLFDAHSYDYMKQQGRIFGNTVDQIAVLLKGLRETPYDSRRSMLEMTTVMITSEFSRTMRIENFAIDQTGTNHNCLSNTVLLGGKGIRGGLVVGASDFQAADEKLSRSHAAQDPASLKAMGRPFDFKMMKPRSDLPESFEITDHLTIASVINTVYKNFGNPVSRYRPVYTNKPVAPTLDGLLV